MLGKVIAEYMNSEAFEMLPVDQRVARLKCYLSTFDPKMVEDYIFLALSEK